MFSKGKNNLTQEQRIELATGLIVDDLKIYKHLRILSESGLDTSLLHLTIHEKVFILAGFDPSQINDRLRENYYRMAEKATESDIIRDGKNLTDIAREILNKLSKL